jgi:hypothetical protein
VNDFFAKFHPSIPMLHPFKFTSALYLPPHMRPPMCLQYIVMSLGALESPLHRHLAIPFYRRARNYMEFDEVDGDGSRFVTLAHAQAWILLACFEGRNMWFSKAAMSVSRSVRLAQVLGLHCVDGEQQRPGPTIPPPADWVEKEERRRTLWAIFSNDRFASSTAGWPTLMDHRIIRTLLPASEEAFLLGVEEPSARLGEAPKHPSSRHSALASRILAVHLFYECLEHSHWGQPRGEGGADGDFWKRNSELNNELATTFVTLPDSLRCPENIHNTQAVMVNLSLHTSSICIHRAAARRAAHATDARERLLPPARAIQALVAAHPDTDGLLGNPIMHFAAFIAASVFLADFVETQDRQSERSLWQLMDVLINVGSGNAMAASLAVQMAHEVKKSGIDTFVLDKVRTSPPANGEDSKANLFCIIRFDISQPAWISACLFWDNWTKIRVVLFCAQWSQGFRLRRRDPVRRKIARLQCDRRKGGLPQIINTSSPDEPRPTFTGGPVFDPSPGSAPTHTSAFRRNAEAAVIGPHLRAGLISPVIGSLYSKSVKSLMLTMYEGREAGIENGFEICKNGLAIRLSQQPGVFLVPERQYICLYK